MPRWSLITVTYNSADTIRRFWTTAPPADVEWIVVDNASTDDSAAVAESRGARVVRLSDNRGFSAANNAGLKIAQGRYIAFVNPDVRVSWDGLPQLESTIERFGGLAAPQLLNADGTLQPNGRGIPLLFHKVLNRLTRADRDNGYRVYAAPDETRYVFWAIGAVVAGREDVVRSIDGWNEDFFLYYEDKDICIRAWLAGYPTVLDGSVQWVHGWARETGTFRLKPWIREFASMYRFYSRYPELLFGGRAASHRHATATELSGSLTS